nr:cyclase-like protein 1 isoform X3 [Lolium perenne]
MAAAVALALLLPVLLQASHALATAAGNAHPGYTGADAGTCGPARHGPGLEEYGGGRIVDITHAYRPVMPGATVQPLLRLKESMEEGSDYNLSDLRMECHTGTHVDAPGHMNQAHFAAGLDVDTLDLDVLNGPALLVDVPRHTNITDLFNLTRDTLIWCCILISVFSIEFMFIYTDLTKFNMLRPSSAL